MGRKNLVYDYKPIVAEDMSQSTVKGKESIVAQFDTVTYEFKWSGGQATNGNFGVEYTRDEHDPKVWRPLDFGTTISADGATGSHLCILTEIPAKFVRPTYDRTNAGASGLLDVSIFSSNKGA